MRTLCLLIAVLLSLPLSAETIGEAAARRTAARFLLGTEKARATLNAVSSRAAALRCVGKKEAAYVFATGEGRFVVTASDDRLPSILGYGTAPTSAMPAALSAVLDGAARILTADAPAVSYFGPDGGKAVAPLLTFTRHQEAPYNNYCPYYTADDGTVSTERCVVGCVATALEEVVSYYRRTVCLRDTLHGWSTAHYTIPDVLPGTTVDTRLIRDNYDDPSAYTAEEADAVARLSYYLGVASHMNYGTGESGANVTVPVDNLTRAFGFGYVHYADSYSYTPADWVKMLRNEIRSGRPVFYSGYAMRIHGHAFVLDGLDDDGLFHVNWGVGGDYDGYFRLDLLNAAEPAYDTTPLGAIHGYFCNQQAILLHPDSLDVTLPDTLARTGRELVIDSIAFDLAPEAGKITPLRLYVRNSASYDVTTPMEIFTNTPADTAYAEQGQYAALTGISLAAGESSVLPVYATFSTAGDVILRISPDDVTIIAERPISVAAAAAAELSYPTPELTFPEEGVVELRQTYANDAAAGRAGVKCTYELIEGNEVDHNGTAHVAYCLLSPGEEKTDTIRFRGLTPGNRYTLLVRCPWTIRHELHFTLPTVDAVHNLTTDDADDARAARYDLLGRRVKRNDAHGPVIGKGKKQFLK